MISPRFQKMSKNERKKLIKKCEFFYNRDYKRIFPDLPDSIKNLDSKNIEAISTIEAITGNRGLLVRLLRMKKTVEHVSN